MRRPSEKEVREQSFQAEEQPAHRVVAPGAFKDW